MDEERLVEVSRELYNMSVDVASTMANIARASRSLRRSAEACGYFAMMFDWNALWRESDRLYDTLHDAYVRGKVTAEATNKATVKVSEFQRETVDEAIRLLKEKCGCK